MIARACIRPPSGPLAAVHTGPFEGDRRRAGTTPRALLGLVPSAVVPDDVTLTAAPPRPAVLVLEPTRWCLMRRSITGQGAS